MMKKIVALLVTVLLLLTVCIPVFAAGNAITLKPTKTSAEKGDTFTVVVALNGNEQFQSFGLKLKFDKNDFEVESGEWLLQGALLSDFDQEKYNAAIGYKNAAVKNGDAFQFTVKVKADAKKTSTIEVVPVMKNDSDDVPVTGDSIDINLNSSAEHTHTYGEWEITKEPSCDEAGQKKRVCPGCNGYETEAIPLTGHSYSTEWTVDEPADCVNTGVKSHHCTKCDAKKEVTHIAALGHKWSEWTVEVEATVNAVGKKVRSCQNEGCAEKQYSEIAKLSSDGHTHAFGDWTVSVKPTCTEKGEQVRTCSVCNEQEKMEAVSTGHKFGDWVIAVAPTTEAEGELQSKCSDCDEFKTQAIPKLLPGESSPAGTDTPSAPQDGTEEQTGNTPDKNGGVDPVIWIVIAAFAVIAVVVVVLVVKNRKK